ncbi:hypothetical protein HYS54_02580 [Candidatus Micrarchaeota archaeon]|nr:hypothetical protein [Candidatus Micrarchaeota archaeon]
MVFESTVERVRTALAAVSKAKNPLIIFDPDADGTLSAALLQAHLKRRIATLPASSALDALDLKIIDARGHDIVIGFDTWTLYNTPFSRSRVSKAFIVDHHPFNDRTTPDPRVEVINPHQESAEPYINTTELVFRALPENEQNNNTPLEDLSLVGSMADLAVHNCHDRLDHAVSRYSQLFSDDFRNKLALRTLKIDDISKEKVFEAVKLFASPMARESDEGALKLLELLAKEKPTLVQLLDPSFNSPLAEYLRSCLKLVDKFVERGVKDFKTKSRHFPEARLRIMEVSNECRAKDIIASLAGLQNPSITVVIKARWPKPKDETRIRAFAKTLINEEERAAYTYKHLTASEEWVSYSLRSQGGVDVSRAASDCVKTMRSKNGLYPNGGGHVKASGASVLLADSERFEKCIIEHVAKQLKEKKIY